MQLSVLLGQQSLQVTEDAVKVSVVLLQRLHNLLILTVQLLDLVGDGYQQLVILLLREGLLLLFLRLLAGLSIYELLRTRTRCGVLH